MELHDQSPAPEKEVTTAVEATQASEAPKTEGAEPAAEVAVEDLESEAIAEEAEEQAHQADERRPSFSQKMRSSSVCATSPKTMPPTSLPRNWAA